MAIKMQFSEANHSYSFKSNRLDSVQDYMKSVCGEHQLDLLNKDHIKFEYEGLKLQKKKLFLGVISYGSSVSINTNHLKSYSISLPLCGQQTLNSNGIHIQSHEKKAIIVSSHFQQELILENECKKLQFVIPENLILEVAQDLLNDSNVYDIEFNPEMDLNSTLLDSWWANVKNFYFTHNSNQSFYGFHHMSEDFENYLIKTLLLTHENSISDRLKYSVLNQETVHINKVKNFIIKNAKNDISVEDLVHASGVSKSKLYADFKKNLNISPCNFFKKYRLEQIHNDLQNHRFIDLNISTIAYKWGINHLSRFSQDYKAEFGESPNETRKNLKL